MVNSGNNEINMRILLVEDEQLVAEYLKLSLTSAGHEVDHAADGNTAYDKAISKGYDVIILDILLPGKNGVDVCREVREYGVQTPILFLTSMEAEESRITGLDAGADDYLTKPFSFPELQARLRALYRRPQSIVSEHVIVGNIKISTTEHRAWLGDEEKDLRSKEFAVLAYLMRNKERAISRDELFRNIWGVSSENASNRVDVCVKELRRKFGKDCIKTISKTGYRIMQES